MIIFRYLGKEILVSTFAVCFALLMVFLSVRFVNLLADAAAGKYAVDVLFEMIGYRMPGFLQIILPLGFYIAVLLAYGRLYMESEMVVLFACGMSQRQLLGVTLVPAALIACLVAVFSFWLAPHGIELYEKVLDEQRNRSEFESLNAGRFQAIGQGSTITFVNDITNNHKTLNKVFIARDSGDKTTTDKSNSTVAFAEYGEQIQDTTYGQHYLVLHDGYKYEGQPGTTEFRVTKFATYGQYMAPAVLSGDYTNEMDAKSTTELLSSDQLAYKVAFQWRISLTLMVLVVTFLGVAFSKTNPRQGRYLKMLPAILVFVFYFVFLTSLRTSMENGRWPLLPGFWIVHAAFLLLAWLVFNWEKLTAKKTKAATKKIEAAGA